MSDLSSVIEFLEKGTFNHNTDLRYMIEDCMPEHLRINLKSVCSDKTSTCFHGQEDEIRKALERFKVFLETKGNFKVGDRVELAETPEITATHSWGWLSSKHFLIKGAKATVADICYYGNQFGYNVIFDDESWQDDKGVIHPTDRKHKHTYFLREHMLNKIPSKPCEFLSRLWRDFYKVGD